MRIWVLLRRSRGRALLAVALLVVTLVARSVMVPIALDHNHQQQQETAIDDNRILDDCQTYDGILLIQHTDMWSGFGTVFFQLIIAQLIYADRYNLLPMIHLGNSSLTVHDPQIHKDKDDKDGVIPRQVTGLMGYSIPNIQIPKIIPDVWYPGPPRRDSPSSTKTTIHLDGTGLWNHYFYNLPTCDTNARDYPLYSMTPDQVSPGLFFHAPWSPKAWRYDRIPVVVAKPYLTLEEWLRPQRLMAAAIVQKYYRIQPSILETVHASLPPHQGDCLGLHIRWSDKKIARRLLSLQEFLPYVQAYIQTHVAVTAALTTNSKPCIYLATDSWLVWEEIQAHWPQSILSHVYQQQPTTQKTNQRMQMMIRSNDTRHVADLGSHHWVNHQTLVDIVALSNCTYLIHGHSAVSESAVYLNPELLDRSINLEDPDRYIANETLFAQHLLLHLGRSHHHHHHLSPSAIPAVPPTRPLEWWWWSAGLHELVHNCSTEISSSITLPLAQRDSEGYWLSASQFTVKIFVELVHQMVFAGSPTAVIVDPILFYWFESDNNNNNNNNSHEFHACPLDTGTFHPSPHNLELWNDTTKQLLASARTRQSYGTTTTAMVGDFDLIRKLVHSVVAATLRPRSFVINRIPSPPSPCLGVWINDPGYVLSSKTSKSMTPRDWPRTEFYHYLQKFQQAGGTCLYVATESQALWEQLVQDWKTGLVIYSQERAARNYGSTKAHWMVDQFERLGSETLVDILSLATLSKVLLHSPHVIAEAALYWNPNLISIPITVVGSESSKITNHKFDDWLAKTFLN